MGRHLRRDISPEAQELPPGLWPGQMLCLKNFNKLFLVNLLDHVPVNELAAVRDRNGACNGWAALRVEQCSGLIAHPDILHGLWNEHALHFSCKSSVICKDNIGFVAQFCG